MRFIILVCLLALSTARRVQVRPRVAEPQIYYEDEDTQQVEDEYSAGGGGGGGSSASVEVYQPRTRALPTPRSKDTLNPSKPPPVQTIRNYNKVNDDGSFTFGYEAADGSFKEETRGTDCVVRGKYGYVDPDGNKREFTYVSGNPCDPNAPKEDDDELPSKQQQEDEPAGPANYPSVRPRPAQSNYPRTTTSKAPTTLFQNEYSSIQDDDASQELEEDDEPNVVIKPTTYRSRPRQSYLKISPVRGESLYGVAPTSATTPTVATTPYRLTTPSPNYQTLASPTPTRRIPTQSYQLTESSTTPRSIQRERPQSVAITPRPHAAQVAAQYLSSSVTERPGIVYATQRSTTDSPMVTSPADIHLNFAQELERYVNSVPVTNRPTSTKQPIKSEAIYQSELIYDPNSGQYNTQLFQNLPQTIGDFRLNHKLQPYVAQGSPYRLQQLQSAQPLQSPSRIVPSTSTRQQQQQQQQQQQSQPQEAIYRQQQSEQLLQSQQLYAQQQRRQQQPVAPKYQLVNSQRDSQNYYYSVSPPAGGTGTQSLSVGQIDQFLRGSNPGF